MAAVSFPPRLALALALAGLALMLAKVVAAETSDCLGPRLHHQLPSGSAWAERVAPLRAELRGARVDPCAQVEIRLEGDGAVVSVTSRGRSAVRRVSEPTELVRTVEALVVLPPELELAALVSPSERVPEAAAPAPHRPHESLRVDVAFGAAFRVGGNVYAGGGLSAMASVVVDRYLLGVTGRWDVTDGYVSEPTASGFNMESGAFGVVVGRRVPAGWTTLDGLLQGQIVLENQEESGPGDGLGGGALDARFGLGLRASPARTAGVRPFAMADVELSPARLVHPRRLDVALPLLPSWTSGVAVGVMWGSP